MHYFILLLASCLQIAVLASSESSQYPSSVKSLLQIAKYPGYAEWAARQIIDLYPNYKAAADTIKLTQTDVAGMLMALNAQKSVQSIASSTAPKPMQPSTKTIAQITTSTAGGPSHTAMHTPAEIENKLAKLAIGQKITNLPVGKRNKIAIGYLQQIGQYPGYREWANRIMEREFGAVPSDFV